MSNVISIFTGEPISPELAYRFTLDRKVLDTMTESEIRANISDYFNELLYINESHKEFEL